MAGNIANIQRKNICEACAPKQVPAIISCKGCLKDYCRKHFNEHRDKLSNDLHNVFDRHYELLQALQLKTEHTSNPTNNPHARALLKQIDEWKTRTIENVLRTADEVSANVEYIFSRKIQPDELKHRMDSIREKLQELQESDSFVETHIDQCTKQLEQLKIDLSRPLPYEIDPPVLQFQPINWNAVIKIQGADENYQKCIYYYENLSNQGGSCCIPPPLSIYIA